MVLGVLAHYGGIDEMAVILVPVIMVLGLWYLFRDGDTPNRTNRRGRR